MKEFKVGIKLFEYLSARSGRVIPKAEIIKKFSEKPKHKEEKKKKEKRFWEKKEVKKDMVEDLLLVLQNEKLIIMDKKNIHIARPFTMAGRISFSKRGDGFVMLPSGNEAFVFSGSASNSVSGDTVELRPISVGKKNRIEAEVIRILKRGRTLYRMTVTEIDEKYIFGRFLDMTGDGKEGFIRKKTLLLDIASTIHLDDVLIVKLKESPGQDENILEAVYVKTESGEIPDRDLNRILMKYNYNQVYADMDLTFPDEVNEKTVTDWGSRVDLRDIYTVTIDGAKSKDFDDAISLVEEGKRIRFYVHIADVSYYVKEGSLLDEEAYARSTSVYLADTVVPMLPPILSEDLCSLVANKNRLAFTVEMTADWSGKIYSAHYYKSIIKVTERYTYDRAESEILENKNKPDSENWILKCRNFAYTLRQKRIESGRVDLNIREVYLDIDENRKVVGIKTRDRLESHILIEEFMLSANIKVAEYLRKNKIPALFRIHEPMDEEKLESLNTMLKLSGFKFSLESTEYDEIKQVLQLLEGHPSEKTFNYYLLRSFMQAYYSGESLGHWGLGFKDYCHFTSPIRRYPDLVCHRALDSLIKDEEPPYSKEEILEMGVHTSKEERRAADAERDLVKIKSCRYISQSGVKEFTGIITGIKPHSVFVELEGYYTEGVVDYTEFTRNYELIMPNDFSFVSQRHSKTFRLGDRLDLTLFEVDTEDIKIRLKVRFMEKEIPKK
jgi:ribonuclease R